MSDDAEPTTAADTALDKASIESYKSGDQSVKFRSIDELAKARSMELRQAGRTRTFTRGRPV